MPYLSERTLFYALLLFWFVGVVVLLAEHPSNCLFFTLPAPGSGRITPTNPHETPVADWKFNLTHVLTLVPYALVSLVVQLVLLTAWFLQMSNHVYLQERGEREAERGRRMRQYGWARCLRSVLRDRDEDVELELQQRNGNGIGNGHAGGGGSDPMPADAQRFECVCGCCWLFSTSCTLLFFNVAALLTLVYLLVIGSGTFESTARYAQNPECRRGMPALVYILSVNSALVLLYVVLLLVRFMCQARSVVQGAVQIGKQLHNRLQTRRARRGASGAARKTQYATLGPAQMNMDPELGLELSDDDENPAVRGAEEDGYDDDNEQLELELHDLSVEDQDMDAMFMEEEQRQQQLQFQHQQQQQRQLYDEHKQHQQQQTPQKLVHDLRQPRPHRSAAVGGSPSANGVNGSHAAAHSADGDPPLDDDTREMLEMLGSGAPPDADDDSGIAAQLEHQRRAEAALDAMEAETAMP